MTRGRIIKKGQETSLFDSKSWVLSVSQFLDAINLILTSEKVFVIGEVAEYKTFGQWASFSLKDKEDGSLLHCFLPNWVYKNSGVLLENGMEVKVFGVPRVYKPRGSFSFQIEAIEPLGEGSFKKSYDLLLKKLETEGLFARKRVIPEFIKNIGVISSRDGVVIHDLLKNLKPLGYKINFINSRVEGENAVDQLVKSIRWFNKNSSDLDVLVIVRGGGSLESLQAFNNEVLAREIFASKIPVIVGIGHEVDVPIACLVADYSASTPTAVANFINDSWNPLTGSLPVLQSQIFLGFDNQLRRTLYGSRSHLDKMMAYFKSVFREFGRLSETIIAGGLDRVKDSINKKLEFIDRAERLINVASPLRSLKLGYSIITGDNGRVIKSVAQIKKGEKLRSRVSDGEIISVAEDLLV